MSETPSRWRRPWLFALRVLPLAMTITTASASAIPEALLLGRQSTDVCPKQYAQCKLTNFPDNFCCPTEQSCIALAADTTVLCCPKGESCARLKPIVCDISLQDVKKLPNALIKTTALTVPLPRCGEQRCCPFGYSCVGGTECVMDKDQTAPPGSTSAAKPSQTSTQTSTTIAPTGTTATTAPNQPTNPADSTNGAVEPSETETTTSGSGPPAAVIGGVTAGVAIAIILAIVVACVLMKRKKKAKTATPSLKLSRSSSSFGNIISNPIIVEGTAMRSDFNRGPAKRSFESSIPPALAINRNPPGSSGSSSSGASGSRGLTANGLRHSSVAYGGPPPYTSPPPLSRNDDVLLPPRTPRNDREPSSVSINVFADPLALTPESASNTAGARGRNTERYSNMTTFTQLMDEADLGGVARGQGYVPFGTPNTQGGSPARRRD